MTVDSATSVLPERWTLKKLKYVARMASGDAITSDEIRETDDYPVFGGNGLRGFTDRFNREGDYVLIGRQGALCGNINYASGKFWASEHAIVADTQGTAEVRWLGELLSFMNLNQYSQSAAQPGIAVEVIANLPIPVPPRSTQHAIALFLNRETAEIDILIAAKQRLLELMAEKRRAIVAEAVMRGLNPGVRLRPSGIDWLGDIPAHWEVKKLKYLGNAIIGLTYDPVDIVDSTSGTLVLRASNVKDQKIVLDDTVYVRSNIPEQLLTRDRDILICVRSGSRALVGKCAMIDQESSGNSFGAFMTIFRGEFNGFLFYAFNSPLFEYQSSAFSTTTINQLTNETLNNIHVPFPPLAEQYEIVSHIAAESAKIDRLRAATEHSIALLKERRGALIAAAVTGQIDIPEAA